jgi:hypothetical protein
VTFDVAEAAIAGVVFDTEDKVIIGTKVLEEPMPEPEIRLT